MTDGRCVSKGIFQTAHLDEAADVSRLGHGGTEPYVDDTQSSIWLQKRRTERQNIRTVVLAGVSGDGLVGRHHSPDAPHLVRRYRRSDTGPVDHDTGVCLSPCNGFRNRSSSIRIIDRRGTIDAEVVHFDGLAAQVMNDGLP